MLRIRIPTCRIHAVVIRPVRAFLVWPAHHCLELTPQRLDAGEFVADLDDAF